MIVENGEWLMQGARRGDPDLIHDFKELTAYVERAGFLPLFSNGVEGFSAEEHADARYWWTGDPVRDPWEWRVQAARSDKMVYGKFFGGKAGFISLEWLPYFANWRRRGYDFDSLYEEGLAKHREKCIMELFEDGGRLFSHEVKNTAGFGKGGLKNFAGIMTELQDKLYLTVTDFRCRRNKRGDEYGMPVAQYAMPESVFGYDAVTSAYGEDPEASRDRIFDRLRERCPGADEGEISKLI